MDIGFLITTYNRRESCQRLVDSLQGLGIITVAVDGSNYTINGATNLNPRMHLGKLGYWRLVNMLYRNRPHAKYYFMMPDDFAISESQIMKAIELWEGIEDPQKICLSIAEGRPHNTCWTNFNPQDKGNVCLSQWVDGCFLCEDKFFQILGTIPTLFPSKKGSSGVGAYISRHFHRNRFNMYQVKESLVTITEEHYRSQMHV